MMPTVSPITLLDVASRSAVAAELWDAITDRQLADWEAEWVPALFEGLQRLNRAGVTRADWPRNRHWDWRRKTEALQGMLAHPGFSIMCNGVTQGMMLLDTTMKRCRLAPQSGKNLVYVEFIESAPWNRAELLAQPRFGGIGTVLIRAAIELSKDEDFKGRVGLHSLPAANGFYANTCGMTDMGADQAYQGLRYFEMTSEQAEAFIQRGEQP